MLRVKTMFRTYANRNSLLFSFLLGIVTFSYAQPTNWRLTLLSGDTLYNITLVKISGDSLNISCDDANQWIKVAQINEIRQIKEFKAWETAKRYALISGLAGGTLAAIVIAISAHGGSKDWFSADDFTVKFFGVLLGFPVYGAIFWILGGVVGSVVAIAEGGDVVYDLSHINLKGKLYTLQLILDHK